MPLVCLSTFNSQLNLLIYQFNDSKTFIGGVAVARFKMFWHWCTLKLTRSSSCLWSRWMHWEPKSRPVSKKVIEQLVWCGLLFTSSTFSFPSSGPFTSLPRDYFMSSCWKSPCLLKGILHWHSAAIADKHVIWLRSNTTSFQSFSHLKNYYWEANILTRRMLFPWWLKRCKHGFESIFQWLSSQTELDYVCLLWQTGQRLGSMFSI